MSWWPLDPGRNFCPEQDDEAGRKVMLVSFVSVVSKILPSPLAHREPRKQHFPNTAASPGQEEKG